MRIIQIKKSGTPYLFNLQAKNDIYLEKSWKYDIRRNVNPDLSIVTMRRVAIIFFELGVIKNFMQKFQSQDTSWLFFCLKNCA